MLKIKDNVDLIELEKFGFEEIKCGWTNKKYTHFVRSMGCCAYKILIEKDNRRIHFNIPTIPTYDLLFDLISAGLVEKVGE